MGVVILLCDDVKESLMKLDKKDIVELFFNLYELHRFESKTMMKLYKYVDELEIKLRGK